MRFPTRPRPSPPETYFLTVENGSGDGPYPVGREVTVTADPAQPGEEFYVWEGDTAILDDFTREDYPSIDYCSRRHYYCHVFGTTHVRGDGDKRDRRWKLLRRGTSKHQRISTACRPAVCWLDRQRHICQRFIAYDFIHDAFLSCRGDGDLLGVLRRHRHRSARRILQRPQQRSLSARKSVHRIAGDDADRWDRKFYLGR